MKKILCFFLVCFFIAYAMYGQKFHGGLRLAMLFTQVDGDDWSGYKKVGILGGGFANFSFLDEKIKLQLELNYAQKGSKAPADDRGIPYRLDIHQLEMPVIFGWNFWKGFWVEVGPSFNFNCLSKESFYGQQVSIADKKFNLFLLEGVAGLGYCFRGHFMVYARFGYSFTPTGKLVTVRDAARLLRKAYNNVLQFGFSYQF